MAATSPAVLGETSESRASVKVRGHQCMKSRDLLRENGLAFGPFVLRKLDVGVTWRSGVDISQCTSRGVRAFRCILNQQRSDFCAGFG